MIINQSFLPFFLAFTRKRIDLKSMLGVYVVMSVGIVLAFVALIAEILWKRRAKQETIKLKRFVKTPNICSLQFQCFFLYVSR